MLGVKPPQYDAKRAVIPSPQQLQRLRTAGDDAFALIIDLMSRCGLRNGEAAAVNLANIVAEDVYRVHEQVNQTTNTYARLKHRKPDEYRDVPLPARVKQTIEWYADTHGTVDGYLLRHPPPLPIHPLHRHLERLSRLLDVHELPRHALPRSSSRPVGIWTDLHEQPR